MDKPRIGIIGIGTMGRTFTRIVAESRRAELAGVVDIDVDRAKAIAEEWHTTAYADTEALLEKACAVDALVIATPDDEHVKPAIVGAQAGKHLFVEKPLALCIEDGQAIIDAARKAGVTLLVGHTLRFDPRYAMARQAIVEGRLGELIHLYTRRNAHIETVRRYGERVSVAGFLGIHDADFLLWATGSEVRQVYAAGRYGFLASQGIELHDTIFSLLTFDTGVLACMETGWCVPDAPGRMYSQLLEVQGSQGEIHILPEATGLTVRGSGFLEYPNAVYEPEVGGRFGGAYRDEIEHFIDCITLGCLPLAPGDEALKAVAVVSAIHRSLDTGLPVGVESQ